MDVAGKTRNFFQNFGLGTSTFFEAFGFVFKNGLWHYFFYPLIISVGIFLLGAWGADALQEWLTAQVMKWLGVSTIENPNTVEGMWNSAVEWLSGAAGTIVSFAVRTFALYIFYRFQKYVMLILLSPILAYLSERTEKIITGNDYPFDLGQFGRDIWRGILLAMRNMVIEFSIIIGCSVLNWFVPIFIPFTWLFLFAVGAYFYGFSMMDYANERRRLSIKQSVHFIRNNKGIAIANGGFFQLFLYIPIVGMIFAPICGVVGATLAAHRVVDLSKNPYAVHASHQSVPEKTEG